jgi:hypothetical protein
VHRLAGVLFQVRALNLDIEGAAIVEAHRKPARADDRQFVLADLVALWQIRVKVVFARKYTLPRDLRADSQACVFGSAP